MRLLLLEDDSLQAEWISNELGLHFPEIEILRIATESEFRNRFEEIASNPPDVAVLDVMLRWSDLGPSVQERPDDIRQHGHFRAGLRCERMITSDPRTRGTRVVMYTVLSARDLGKELESTGQNVVYLAKDSDVSNLIMLIRSLLEAERPVGVSRSSVFIVHGHDIEAKETVARFIEKLGATAVVLHEQPSLGRTVIEKFEKYSGVRFAIVLLTPDDVGAPRSAPKKLSPRARQNVVFELGFFVAKLGRKNVCALYKEGVEIPSDYHGIVYITMDSNGGWRNQLARELLAAGVEVDTSKVF